MKKIYSLVLLLLFVPLFAGASFDKNLYYGLQKDVQVKELQQFLTNKKLYTGPISGNFLTMTLSAVKKYQVSVKLPSTGYVGIMTRTAIKNDIAKSQVVAGVTDIVVSPSPTLSPTPTVIPTPSPTPILPSPSPTPSPAISGCMDVSASNYDASAKVDNGTCQYVNLKYSVQETDNSGVITRKLVFTAVSDDFVIEEYFFKHIWHGTNPGIESPYYIKDDNGLKTDGYLSVYNCATRYANRCVNQGVYNTDYLVFPNILLSVPSGATLTISAGDYIDGQIVSNGFELVYMKATGMKTKKTVIILPNI